MTDKCCAESIHLSFPELETEVVECSQKGSNETTSPEPQVEVALFSGQFFCGGRWRTFLQRKGHRRWLLEGGGKVVLNAVLQQWCLLNLLLDSVLGHNNRRRYSRNRNIRNYECRCGVRDHGQSEENILHHLGVDCKMLFWAQYCLVLDVFDCRQDLNHFSIQSLTCAMSNLISVSGYAVFFVRSLSLTAF